MKKMRWLRVAQLKALVKRPDLVEAWDITAPDPLFLCDLKTVKNTIQVPRHWNQKSKFLQTKRGILKPMFKLPEFIEATGKIYHNFRYQQIKRSIFIKRWFKNGSIKT